MPHKKKSFITLSFIFLFLGTIILGVNQNNRAFGTLGEPNALAAVAVFLIPFILSQYKGLLKVGVALVGLIIILLSGSGSGFIAFLIQLIFLLFNHKNKPVKSVIVSLSLITFSLFLPFTRDYVWFENRSVIWATGIEAAKASPLIGVGIGNIQEPIHQTALSLNNLIYFQTVDSAHNFLLDFLIQTGIVGLISIIFLIFLTLHSFIHKRKTAETAAFLGIITVMLFNPVSVCTLLAFWWLIGQGSSQD